MTKGQMSVFAGGKSLWISYHKIFWISLPASCIIVETMVVTSKYRLPYSSWPYRNKVGYSWRENLELDVPVYRHVSSQCRNNQVRVIIGLQWLEWISSKFVFSFATGWLGHCYAYSTDLWFWMIILGWKKPNCKDFCRHCARGSFSMDF